MKQKEKDQFIFLLLCNGNNFGRDFFFFERRDLPKTESTQALSRSSSNGGISQNDRVLVVKLFVYFCNKTVICCP